MQYNKLKSLNKKVSKIGLGCVTFGREIDKEQSLNILDFAYESGINLLNTSYYYGEGNSEIILGNYFATRKNRSDFTVVTKIHGNLSSKVIENCINKSLKRMKTDYIDFYGITYDPNNKLEEILETMEKFKKQGKILQVACNNFDYNLLESSKKIQKNNLYSNFGILETVYNILYRGAEKEILNHCNKENIDIITYSPLGAGFITGKYKNNLEFPKNTRFDIKPGHKDIYFKKKFFETINKMKLLSEKTNLALIDLALAWIISKDFISSILIGVRQKHHLEKPIYLLKNKLNNEILKEIEIITKNNFDLIAP